MSTFICSSMFVYADMYKYQTPTTTTIESAPMSVMEPHLLKYRIKYMISSCLYSNVWPYSDFSMDMDERKKKKQEPNVSKAHSTQALLISLVS